MSKKFCLLLLLALVASFSACGGGEDEKESGSDNTAQATATPESTATAETTPEATATEEATPETGGTEEATPEAGGTEEATPEAGSGAGTADACKEALVSTAGGSVSAELEQQISDFCGAAASGDMAKAKAGLADVCEGLLKQALPEGTPKAAIDAGVKSCRESASSFMP